MNNGNLELALRIKSDIGQTPAALATVTKGVDALGASTDAVTRATRSAAASQDTWAKATAMADQNTGKYLQKLQLQYDVLGKNRSELEAMRAKQAGLTSEEQRAAAAIGAKIDAWHRDEDAAKAAARAEEQALRATAGHGAEASDAMKRMGIETVGARRELMVIAHEAVSGNFSRIPGSMMVLAERTDITRVAMGLLLNPVTIAAAVIGTLAIAFMEGEKDAKEFNIAIQATGNYAGVTAGQLDEMAHQANAATGIGVGNARAIAQGMVASGQLGRETIGNLTGSVRAFALATGQEVDKASADLMRLFKDPAKGAEELNKSFHFLIFEELEYIRTLQSQGRTEEAQLVLSQKLFGYLGSTGIANLNGLAKGWNTVATAAADAWTQMKRAMSGTRTKEDMLSFDQLELRDLNSFAGDDPKKIKLTEGRRKELQEKIAAAQAEIKSDQQVAAGKAEGIKADEKRIAIGDAYNKVAEANITREQRRKTEIEALDKAVVEGIINQAEYNKQVALTNERYATKTPKAKSDPVENAFMREKLELSKAIASEQTKIDNLNAGQAAGENLRAAALGEWLKFSKEGAKLLPAQVQQLQALAAQADNLDKILRDKVKVDQVNKRIPDELAALNEQLLQATGRSAEAAAAKIEQRFKKLREDLAITTNPAVDKEGSLIKLADLQTIEKVKVELAELQQQVQQIFGDQTRGEKTIQLNVLTGLISEIDARKQVVALHKSTADQVDALIPKMDELASKTRDPKLADGIANLKIQTAQLRVATNEFGDAFSKSFESGFANALDGLATRTKTLSQAVRGLLSDMAKGLANWAAGQLANQAKTSLMNLTKTGSDVAGKAAGAATTAAAITTAAATGATEMGLGITSGATVAATELATAMTTAGAIAAETIAVAMASAAAAGSAGGSAASGVVSVASSLFSDGGYTGDGGKYQPAGIVHAGEHVTRSEVVRQPGAMSFLNNFNRYGMAALSGLAGYAEGGVVGMPSLTAPALPTYQMAGKAGSSASPVTLNQRVVGLLDDDSIVDALKGPKGEHLLEVVFSRNPSKFRSILKA